jgi:hypothetical protein
MRAALLLCAVALGFTQQTPDPERLLARAQANLSEAAAAVPNPDFSSTNPTSVWWCGESRRMSAEGRGPAGVSEKTEKKIEKCGG